MAKYIGRMKVTVLRVNIGHSYDSNDLFIVGDMYKWYYNFVVISGGKVGIGISQ